MKLAICIFYQFEYVFAKKWNVILSIEKNYKFKFSCCIGEMKFKLPFCFSWLFSCSFQDVQSTTNIGYPIAIAFIPFNLLPPFHPATLRGYDVYVRHQFRRPSQVFTSYLFSTCVYPRLASANGSAQCGGGQIGGYIHINTLFIYLLSLFFLSLEY